MRINASSAIFWRFIFLSAAPEVISSVNFESHCGAKIDKTVDTAIAKDAAIIDL